MTCVVGQWLETLDADDVASFDAVQDTVSRVELMKLIEESEDGVRPFGLTALKTHILSNCRCGSDA